LYYLFNKFNLKIFFRVEKVPNIPVNLDIFSVGRTQHWKFSMILQKNFFQTIFPTLNLQKNFSESLKEKPKTKESYGPQIYCRDVINFSRPLTRSTNNKTNKIDPRLN